MFFFPPYTFNLLRSNLFLLLLLYLLLLLLGRSIYIYLVRCSFCQVLELPLAISRAFAFYIGNRDSPRSPGTVRSRPKRDSANLLVSGGRLLSARPTALYYFFPGVFASALSFIRLSRSYPTVLYLLSSSLRLNRRNPTSRARGLL